MNSELMASFLKPGRTVLLNVHFPRLFPHSSALSDEARLACVQTALNGSQGVFRNPNKHMALVSADNDLAAIESWLSVTAARSEATRRVYQKEAIRVLAWAIIEHGKPLSSLNVEDIQSYESFLKNPVSKHQGIDWVSDAPINEKTGRRARGHVARDNPKWRPFDGSLEQSSIEHSMQVLKSMFSYWTDVGYTVVNPLKVRRKTYQPDKEAALERVLSPATWQFLYQFLDQEESNFPDGASPKLRLSLLRQANQRFMIFTALYLLGVRISELARLKMSDFSRRYLASGDEQHWVKIIGKGGKSRTIPVPKDLLDVVARYRRHINTFPVTRRGVYKEKKYDDFVPLKTLPSSDDTSHLILSASGAKPLTASRLAMIVKETLADAKTFYEQLCESGTTPLGVDPDQLEKASAHWLRHTSATHQSLQGVSLRYVKDYLGHASYDTTIIYNHTDAEQWAKEIGKFRVK